MTTLLPSTVSPRADRTAGGYDEFGAGPPLVLLHPSGFGPALVRPLADELSARHRVVVPHRRGFGSSEGLPPPTSLTRLEDDLSRLLDDLELDHPVVVGVSAGATLALAHARRHPGRAAVTVAHEPLIGPLGGQLHTVLQGRIARLLDRAERPHETSLFMSELVGIRTWNTLRPDWRDNVERFGAATRREASLFGSFALDADALRALADQPVAVTVGQRSPSPRQELADVVADFAIATRTVSGVGHLPPVEGPAAFAAVVRHVSDELEPAGGTEP